ncbi:hypothetical protein [Streptomyces gilvosporeus]|uniref:Uncharacterized protein n=1 Tax=Streptomyces gilvosporeus TaxID=553510 RepID=A0A1V0TQB6_9ACTN|nr:hypothetical protein [Streptomyces gilvosporeus]ARF55147.1 hypothetical protein B1H19_13905 [Streptomyces gilvosporeus]
MPGRQPSAAASPPAAPRKTELIDVIRIADPARHLTSKDLAGDAVAVWERDQAQQVWGLILDLPSSEPYRCFLPGWGIRAHSTAEQLFEIAFCFRCHGARIWASDLPAEQRHQTFDGESPAAQELLRRFRSSVPN